MAIDFAEPNAIRRGQNGQGGEVQKGTPAAGMVTDRREHRITRLILHDWSSRPCSFDGLLGIMTSLAGSSTASVVTLRLKRPQSARSTAVTCRTGRQQAICGSIHTPHNVIETATQNLQKMAFVLGSSLFVAGASQALTYDELQGLTYLQVKGSGIANTCPVLEGGSSNLKDLKPGSYNMSKFCLEPTSFTVKEESQFKGGEPEFVKTKLMTRLTYTLDEISGKFDVDGSGNVDFKEEDGIDYAPVTVQLPGGERVPFLFTIKELQAKGSLGGFGGDFVVPSYRGSSFLDPKGRGGSTGYDNAVALPARSDSDELQKENNKSVAALKGQAVFSVAKIDPSTGEVAGVFESIQPSDTDLGSKAPKDVKITGLWYGQLS